MKPVSEFNVAQKQIGEYKHTQINNFPKEKEEVMLICLSGLYEPLKGEDDGERPAAHVIGGMKHKLLPLPL